LEGTAHSEDIHVNKRKILKWILDEIGWDAADLIQLDQDSDS